MLILSHFLVFVAGWCLCEAFNRLEQTKKHANGWIFFATIFILEAIVLAVKA